MLKSMIMNKLINLPLFYNNYYLKVLLADY